MGTMNRFLGSAVPRASHCETTSITRVIISGESLCGYRPGGLTWGSVVLLGGNVWPELPECSALDPGPCCVPTLRTPTGPRASPSCVSQAAGSPLSTLGCLSLVHCLPLGGWSLFHFFHFGIRDLEECLHVTCMHALPPCCVLAGLAGVLSSFLTSPSFCLLICHPHTFSGEGIDQIFCPFKKLGCFLIEFESSLYVLGTVPNGVHVLQIFSPSL